MRSLNATAEIIALDASRAERQARVRIQQRADGNVVPSTQGLSSIQVRPSRSISAVAAEGPQLPTT